MLRYKNSLLERILLEKGQCFSFPSLTYLTNSFQASMSKPSYVPRRPVQTWGPPM